MSLRVTALRLDLRTHTPLPELGLGRGALVRGVLHSSLTYFACCCSGGERHRTPCPLTSLLEGPRPAEGRPYALGVTRQEGSLLSAELFLYEEAGEQLLTLVGALSALQEHGIGPERQPLVSIELSSLFQGELLYTSQDHILRTHPAAEALFWPERALSEEREEVQTLRLRTLTPLHLGWRDVPGEEVQIGLESLRKSLERRWNALLGPESLRQSQRQGGRESVRTLRAHWSNEARYSVRQRRTLRTVGLDGEWEVQREGSAAETRRWAHLLSRMPLGGKTAFGYGRLELRHGEGSQPMCEAIHTGENA